MKLKTTAALVGVGLAAAVWAGALLQRTNVPSTPSPTREPIPQGRLVQQATPDQRGMVVAPFSAGHEGDGHSSEPSSAAGAPQGTVSAMDEFQSAIAEARESDEPDEPLRRAADALTRLRSEGHPSLVDAEAEYDELESEIFPF